MDLSPYGNRLCGRDGCWTIRNLLRSLRSNLHGYSPRHPQIPTLPAMVLLSPDLSFNTAISFSTTTTWQAYAGESTMSYFSQMVGLCTQNFLAGAAGLAVGIAFIRGLAREASATLGNFWVDPHSKSALDPIAMRILWSTAAHLAGSSDEPPPPRCVCFA